MPMFDEIKDDQLRELASNSKMIAELDAGALQQMIIAMNEADDAGRQKFVELFEKEGSISGITEESLINSINEGGKTLSSLEKEFTKAKNTIVEGEERVEESKTAEELLNKLK